MSDQSNQYSRPFEAANAAPLALDATGFATLLPNTTYLFPVGARTSVNDAVHAQWDAAIQCVSVGMQATCMKPAEVADHAATSGGNWMHVNPPGAYVPVVGGTVDGAVAAVPGGTAGGALWNMANDGSARQRLTVVVGATGGAFRVGQNGTW